MPRTLLVVPDDDRPADHWLDQAQREGAGEIVRGVPPFLTKELDGVELPTVYVVPDPDTPEPEEPSEPEPDPLAELSQRVADQQAVIDELVSLVLMGGF